MGSTSSSAGNSLFEYESSNVGLKKEQHPLILRTLANDIGKGSIGQIPSVLLNDRGGPAGMSDRFAGREIESLEVLCNRGSFPCMNALRYRTVRLRTKTGAGTGFILRSDREWIVILTAAHVVADFVENREILARLVLVADSVEDLVVGTSDVCALRDPQIDIAVVRVRNFRNEIFQQPEYSSIGEGESVLVVEYSGEVPTRHEVEMVSVSPDDRFAFVNRGLVPGASGAAFFDLRGKIMGLLSHRALHKELGVAQRNLAPFLKYRWADMMKSDPESGVRFICN